MSVSVVSTFARETGGAGLHYKWRFEEIALESFSVAKVARITAWTLVSNGIKARFVTIQYRPIRKNPKPWHPTDYRGSGV